MFAQLIESIRLEARTKTQQYHGMIRQTADSDQRKRYASHYKKAARQLADKSARQDKGKSGIGFPGTKKLRSYNPDHDPAYGDRVADDRAYLKKQGKDPLAAKAAKSPRERRRDMRKRARGHR